MRWNWGILRSAVVLMAAALQVTACGVNDVVCPAVGWVTTITVRLEGDLTAVNDVQLCTPEGCSVTNPTSPQNASPKSAVPSSADDRSLAPSPFIASKASINTWLFTVSGPLPDEVTTHVSAKDGTLIAQQHSHLEWTRVGGSEQCGGQMATPPIILQLPVRQPATG
ncbi:hypothetical protein [Arthrobacter sp. ov118]|uniref:hypothetical protein n=1 Tax=Arthrobacter sp. ov118 TaxID=1761747 RepID=UPI0008E5FC59|nr:hypothetical protein [Arthrobacter sp. ov118]SFT70147.1 hypothetical protein SAMN04487915_102296 [Arthrobacter sp. ov118]